MAKILPITPSLLNVYLLCPKQYDEKYNKKSIKYVQSEQALFGDSVHKSTEAALKDGQPLNTDALPLMEGPVAALANIKDNPRYTLHVEQRLAITKDMKTTTWWAADAWMRAQLDAHIEDHEQKRNIIIDWKTGKVKPDKMQVLITSLCATVHTKYTQNDCAWVFVKHNQILAETVDLRSMSAMDDLLRNAKAYETACRDDHFPATPNFLCRSWCGVMDCPHNGKNK